MPMRRSKVTAWAPVAMWARLDRSSIRAAAGLALPLLMTATSTMAADSKAVDAQYTPALQRCLNTSEGASTPGMIDCFNAELKIQDARLNATYRQIQADLNPRQKAGLTAAQRAWIAYRDADCASLEDPDWGTASRIAAAQCVLQRTVERTLDLKAEADSR